MRYWMALCAIPGLNIRLYFAKSAQPTRAEIDAAWMAENPEGRPLKWDTENLPLRDCYPGCAGVEEIKVVMLPKRSKIRSEVA